MTEVTRKQLEFSDEEAVAAWAEKCDAEWVVNCAAISGLEACLDDPLTAHLVNARAPELIAGECHRRGIAFLHISTDYVLDGRRPGRHDETTSCKPVNVYGQSKLEGELRIQEVSPSAWISRISWIFGPDLPSFPHQVLERAMQGQAQQAIGDKFSLPTFADDFVTAWESLAVSKIDGGVYQMCNEGEPVSWADIADETLRLAADLGAPLKESLIERTSLKDAHFFRDKRPPHTAMACKKLADIRGALLRPWQVALGEHLGDLADDGWRLPSK